MSSPSNPDKKVVVRGPELALDMAYTAVQTILPAGATIVVSGKVYNQADLLKDPQWQAWLDAGKTADLVRAAKAKGDDDQAAVALAMVAAAIPGRSVVRNAEIIKRAHPRFVENLRSLGAELE